MDRLSCRGIQLWVDRSCSYSFYHDTHSTHDSSFSVRRLQFPRATQKTAKGIIVTQPAMSTFLTTMTVPGRNVCTYRC